MPIIVNNQPQLGKTTDYRLSIQADLNGFSFSVTDEQQDKLLFLYQSEFVMEIGEMELFSKKSNALFKSMPLLSSKYKSVDLIYGTEKFTVIPEKLHIHGQELQIMERLFTLDELDEINTKRVPQEQMVLIFAANSTFLNIVKEYQPKFNLYPSAFTYLNYLPLFEEYNKLFFRFQKGTSIIIAAEGERIMHCNSYPTQHFNSGLYFLLLVLKEIQFNPEQTTVYISGDIKDLEVYDIAKYFSKVKYFRNPEIPLPHTVDELRHSTLLFEV